MFMNKGIQSRLEGDWFGVLFKEADEFLDGASAGLAGWRLESLLKLAK
jgi:hypothetical protein